MSGDGQTWEGVLIYEIGAKLRSTTAEPRTVDPSALGERLRRAIEEAINRFDSQGELQVADVQFAGSRGSTRYEAP